MDARKGPGPDSSVKEQLLAGLCLGGLLPVLSWVLESSVLAFLCSLALSFVVSGLWRQRALVRRAADQRDESEPPAS